MRSRFTMIVAVHLFLIKDHKILLARRFNTGYEDGNFSVPAGHVEENETCVAAMIREAQEEINLELKSTDLSLAHVMHRKTDNDYRIDFFFACQNWSGTPIINEPHKCDLIEWHSLESLPGNTIDYIQRAVKLFAQKQTYSELGFEE
jgi:8-oxo-dGTP diphosphatase